MKNLGCKPYFPSWEYIPDGEPHVFAGRVYIYGSHDRAGVTKGSFTAAATTQVENRSEHLESLVVRDLKIYCQCLDGGVSHYRNKDGLEADAILHLSD